MKNDDKCKSNGVLYVVGTPIGNLMDITLRALDILRDVDFVACEDTRRTAILLNEYKIKKELVSYHQHSKLGKIDWIVGRLVKGENAALVSDAGTPGIADPGGSLVEAAVEAGVDVVPIPGPSAVATLVSISGMAADKFIFLGYLPKKKGRQTLLDTLKDEKRPVIIYESPERIDKTLIELVGVFGESSEVVIGRELTKMFEEIIRGRLGEIIEKLPNLKKKGEFVLWISR